MRAVDGEESEAGDTSEEGARATLGEREGDLVAGSGRSRARGKRERTTGFGHGEGGLQGADARTRGGVTWVGPGERERGECVGCTQLGSEARGRRLRARVVGVR